MTQRAALLDGVIDAGPLPGRGFRVTARFPLSRVEPPTALDLGRPVRVLLADDEPLMRTALRECLRSEPDLEPVGEASDGLEAVRLARQLHPDVILMDLRMPGIDGISVLHRLAATEPDLARRVLVISGFDLPEHIVAAARAGASGFVFKDTTPAELAHAVRSVAPGSAALAPRAARSLLDQIADRLAPPLAGTPELARLTAREHDVLTLTARGLANREIADRLHIAPSSVKTHLAHIFAKLGLAGRTELTIFAYEHGVLIPGNPESEAR